MIGLQYYEFLITKSKIFDKLNKNYTDESKEVFFDELKEELMKSKIMIKTYVFPNGYCTRVRYLTEHTYIKGDDLETFLLNNNGFYFKADMFLD